MDNRQERVSNLLDERVRSNYQRKEIIRSGISKKLLKEIILRIVKRVKKKKLLKGGKIKNHWEWNAKIRIEKNKKSL